MYTYIPPRNNKASKIKIDDIDNNFQSADVEGALKELAENGGSGDDSLVATNIIGTTLTLTTDKYQITTMVNGTEIVLPTVSSFTEIHLFFSASTNMTLILPNCKWQSQPTITSGKYYELIFTYTDTWLGGVVVYG